MSDNKELRGPQDAKRISLEEDYEVRYWCNKFGCSEDELRKVVKRVGNSASAVEAEFSK